MKSHYNVEEMFVMPGMSAFGFRFKGGSSSPEPEPVITNWETPLMARSRRETYPMIQRAIRGQGFGPAGFLKLRQDTAYSGYDKSFGTMKDDLHSQLNRTLDPDDKRSYDSMSQLLDRQYNIGRDNIRRGFVAEKVQDKDIGMGMATDALAKESRMAIGGASMYNQAIMKGMAQDARFGTFESNIAGGAGSFLMDAYYAKQMTGGKTL